MDGDREILLEAEQPPGEEFPEGGPAAIRNLDTDPFLRIQVRLLFNVHEWELSVSLF